MSHAVTCNDCDETVWSPAEAEGPGGQTEIAACRLALKHVRETEHTDVDVVAGCYYVGEGDRPTAFGDGATDPDDVRVPDRSKLANAVAGAARQLRSAADSAGKWDDPRFASRQLRQYAVAVESNIAEEDADG